MVQACLLLLEQLGLVPRGPRGAPGFPLNSSFLEIQKFLSKTRAPTSQDLHPTTNSYSDKGLLRASLKIRAAGGLINSPQQGHFHSQPQERRIPSGNGSVSKLSSQTQPPPGGGGRRLLDTPKPPDPADPPRTAGSRLNPGETAPPGGAGSRVAGRVPASDQSAAPNGGLPKLPL